MPVPPFPAPDDKARFELERQMAARMGCHPTRLGRAAVGLLAAMQGGCVARWQLRWLGISDATISDIARRQGWTTMHAGVWLLPGARNDLLARIWAAVLAVSDQDGPALADAMLTPDSDPLTVVHGVATERAVVTGETAAWIRGLSSWPPPHEPVLLLANDHNPQRSGIRIIRTVMNRQDGTSYIAGLRVAGGPRLLWDVSWACRGRPGAVARVADLAIVADRTRLMSIDYLLAMVDEPCLFALPMRVPGVLRQAAEVLRPGFSHSATEALGRRIAGEVASTLGLEVHPRPYPIRRDGRIIAEADIAVLALRHDIEVDGPHHDQFAQKARDRGRDGGMAEIGWSVTRYRVALIDENERRYAELVQADLQARLDEAA
ncbi:MAG TPA: hypothetical protein VMM13_18740 [Euzebya sp.]|nr:hypothetical protein [Euzebya sp.]